MASASSSIPHADAEKLIAAWRDVFTLLQIELQSAKKDRRVTQTLVTKLDTTSRNLARFAGEAERAADESTDDIDPLTGLRLVS